jgi:hypothetical protein
MDKKDFIKAVMFNLNALKEGVINEDDFVQAIEEELNLL